MPSNLQKTNEAHEIAQAIAQHKERIAKEYLIIGNLLIKVRNEKLWGHYGEHLHSLEDFIEEVRLKKSTAYNCIGIVELLGPYLFSKKLQNGFDIEYTRLVRLLPIVRANKNATEEWLVKARDLTNEGYWNALLEAQGRPTRDECTHEWEELRKCVTCKLLVKKV